MINDSKNRYRLFADLNEHCTWLGGSDTNSDMKELNFYIEDIISKKPRPMIKLPPPIHCHFPTESHTSFNDTGAYSYTEQFISKVLIEGKPFVDLSFPASLESLLDQKN
jgi:hypothetical protein